MFQESPVVSADVSAGLQNNGSPGIVITVSRETEVFNLGQRRGSTEIPVNLVPVQSDHSLHCGTLFATQVSLRRLYRDMSQQELNLLQFTAGLMAQAGASPAKVVRCESRNLTVLCFLFHDTPNDFGAESVAPNPASLVDRTKESPRCNPGGSHPSVNSGLYPIRNWDSSYVASFADKVGYDPVLLSLLYVFNA